MKKVIYACDEHVDYIIDDFINNYNVAPDINLVNGMNCSCEHCSELVKYMISFDLD